MSKPRFCLSTLLLFLCLCLSCRAADFVVITHPSGPDTVSKDDMKNILLGNKTKWEAGGVIKLAVLAGGDLHAQVVQTFTARSADQFEKYWKKLVFTGKGTAPGSMADTQAMLAYVAKTAGSIGYVEAGAPLEGVKAVTVQ